MSPTHALLLLVASFVAGALNSIAGGGSFITFPVLLLVGVSPVMANATSTVGLWPASVAGALAYRREFARIKSRELSVLGIVSLAGGLAGALLLLRTGDDLFARLVPYLLLGATLLFTVGPWITRRLKGSSNREMSPAALAAVALVQAIIAIYGGYFGGGVSILILAALSLVGMTDMHLMNAAKVVLTGLINGISVVAFIVAHSVVWPAAGVMVFGAICGGYFGASAARTIAPSSVRTFVLAVAWSITAVFFVKSGVFK